jgi:ribosomal protein S17E
MTYDKLLQLLKEERKRLDKRITGYLTMLVLQGDGRRLVLAVKKMGR